MRNLHLGLYTPNQGVPKHSGSLFHSTRAVPEKILEEEFGVAMNEELEREVLVMCNLSQGVKAEGISIGEMQMLVKQVRKGRVTIEEAAEDAGMTVEEFKKILENGQKLVQGMQVHKQLMLQIMPQRIAAHHLLRLFVQLAIDKNRRTIFVNEMRILCRIIGGSHTIKSYSKLTPSDIKKVIDKPSF